MLRRDDVKIPKAGLDGQSLVYLKVYLVAKILDHGRLHHVYFMSELRDYHNITNVPLRYHNIIYVLIICSGPVSL